jgi:DNA-binding beta-propeller fold protein YncE
MYQIAEIIGNDRAPSHVAEISFHPSGSYFAATYENINEVRIFDSRTRKLLQVLENPESQIYNPHGVLFTEKHLLVSNAHDFTMPGTINVYRNDGVIIKLIQIFQTPFSHLREPHSLALRDGRLVVTYAENVAPSGAIVSYGFNEETGEITGLLDKSEAWFSEYGDPKGISFNADGTKVLVTFKSNKQFSITERIFRAIASDGDLPPPTRVMKFITRAIRKFKNKLLRSGRAFKRLKNEARSEGSVGLEGPNPHYVTPTKNGIATFSINSGGKIARSPDQVIVCNEFCRLENIAVFENICAVTDTVNHLLLLYDLSQDQNFTSPLHTVNFDNATPHGAKFSPDGRMLVISSLGRKVVNQELMFRFVDWEFPREDKIFVFERSI